MTGQTVGGMVEDYLREALGERYKRGRHEGRWYEIAMNAIHSLGIWDAEVVEGSYVGSYGMRYDPDEPDASPAEVQVAGETADLETWFEEKAVRGETAGCFRVIFLPVKEGA